MDCLYPTDNEGDDSDFGFAFNEAGVENAVQQILVCKNAKYFCTFERNLEMYVVLPEIKSLSHLQKKGDISS